MRYSDDELLKLVGEERKRSIGFGEGDSGELRTAREKALNYYKGEVSDVPALAGRSSAVSTDVAEAVETALPDLIELFIAGDDVATFTPSGQADEAKAQEESDYVKHVIFSENEGFLTFNAVFKDALLCRTGLFHWYREDQEKTETETYDGPPEQMAVAHANAQQQGAQVDLSEAPDGGLSMVAELKRQHVKICIKAVPPEDFTVAADTVSLKSATYCAMRERPRVQDLIARGVKPEIARELKGYVSPDNTVELARDEAGESRFNASEGSGDLRQVEVRAHYLRLLDEETGKLEVWRITTDSEETVLVEEPEKVGCIPFGAITPYLNAHRFHGESVADKLLEIQRIKTTLLRMFLDSGYFALNQRMEVDMSRANEFTISDLLRNEPNMPVRTNGAGAVTSLRAGGLDFDALAALEHVSVMGEARTGIVRNAQGLKPDTLHDTAKGAIALITAAQKRIRYIGRVFAETGVKELFLGVHALLREAFASEAPEGAQRAIPHVKMGHEWKDVDPSGWQERESVEVQVGVGSAGREHDLMVATQVMQTQSEMLAAGLGGQTVTPQNVYNAGKRFIQAANWKSPELYFSDPSQQPPQPPKPDPEMAKVQAQAQLEQQKAQTSQQLEQAKHESSMQLENDKHQAQLQANTMQAQNDNDLAMAKLQGEMELKRWQIEQELQLKREQLTAELELKRELGFAQAQVGHEVGMAKVNASTSTVEPGGDPG